MSDEEIKQLQNEKVMLTQERDHAVLRHAVTERAVALGAHPGQLCAMVVAAAKQDGLEIVTKDKGRRFEIKVGAIHLDDVLAHLQKEHGNLFGVHTVAAQANTGEKTPTGKIAEGLAKIKSDTEGQAARAALGNWRWNE